jgi:hypothetical protein
MNPLGARQPSRGFPQPFLLVRLHLRYERV